MKTGSLSIITTVFFALCASTAAGQCQGLELSETLEIDYPFVEMCMTPLHDQQGQDFIYTADLANGVGVYDISSGSSKVVTISTDELENLKATSLWQEGNYLYVALGDHFSNRESSGLAIINVENPESAEVINIWKNSENTGGAGIVRTQGDFAYLGAMQHGLIILDISDKSNISEVGRMVPDINFPESNPDPEKYNARGLDIVGDIAYLCYDAGGVRVIDISDKSAPRETGRYSLPLLDGLPRAYNNCIADGNKLYVATDYCGMEILDISDTSNITQIGWWNEWACETSSNIWFNSPGHTNEIAYLPLCNQVVMSAGKREAVFVDVSDPEHPILCDVVGSETNNQGTWGMSFYDGTLYLGYIVVPLGIPFFSNYGGVKGIEVGNSCALGTFDFEEEESLTLIQTSHSVELQWSSALRPENVKLLGADGQLLLRASLNPESRNSVIPLGHISNQVIHVVLEGKDQVISRAFAHMR